ncbi:winged helix-turn-helix transcriptional regulator [Halosimplex litoreum]|uniref:Winged helix-turn-helix transcriptional regulator n=1 Tax=Halosimplex litoreum TaxID=1198301 RepID=A0A7T3FZX2_9EURY|nr:winged helix-turn-helix domain-containing protein [Halosimplex litoreum]QPV63798.1 winged helix-turn-helix transcriptional regulator [Halosimplex litoreum]
MADRSGSEETGEQRGAKGSEAEVDSDAVAPTALFELLADETRLSIVRELAGVRRSNWQWAGLSFADLRRAVGVEDAGNFSYHLEKLRGPLVVKDGEEYHLRNRGMQLVSAVESGEYTGPGETVRGETEFDCPYPDCDRALEVAYDDQYCRIRCPDHHVFNGTAIPPVAADHLTASELLAVTMLDLREQVERARAGVCPNCWGPVDAALPSPAPSLPSMDDVGVPDDALLATFTCGRCPTSFDLPPGACVVDHPAVLAFYHDHGEDIRYRPYVALPFCSIGRADLESEEPVRVRVDVRLDDDTLHLWLDAETNVVEYERA